MKWWLHYSNRYNSNYTIRANNPFTYIKLTLFIYYIILWRATLLLSVPKDRLLYVTLWPKGYYFYLATTRLPGLGDEKNMANYLLGFCREVSNLITFYRNFISLSSIIPVSYWLISLYRRLYALLIMILIRCHFFIFKFFKSENGFLKRKKFYTSNERFFFGKSVLRVHLDVRFFIILTDICRW